MLVVLLASLGSDEDKGLGSIGVRGGEQGRKQAALGDAHDDDALRANRIENGPDVVHAIFHRARLDPIGQSHAALVEQNEAAIPGDTLAELGNGLEDRCAQRPCRRPTARLRSGRERR